MRDLGLRARAEPYFAAVSQRLLGGSGKSPRPANAFDFSRVLLVTGGAGFIGSALCSLFATGSVHCRCGAAWCPSHIVIVDCLGDKSDAQFEVQLRRIARVRQEAMRAGVVTVSFEREDITDNHAMHGVFARYRPSVVCHLTAKPGVRWCEAHPQRARATNELGTTTVLEAAASIGTVLHVISASSSSVYGHVYAADCPSNEELTPTAPVGVYARSKLAGERIASAMAQYNGLRVSVIRPFSVYGIDGRRDMAPLKFLQLLHRRQPIQVFGDGSASRDFTYVGDAARAIAKLIGLSTDAATGPAQQQRFRVYNIGTGVTSTVADLVTSLEACVGRHAAVQHEPVRGEDAVRTLACTQRAAHELCWKLTVSLQQGVRLTTQWFWQHCPVSVTALIATCGRPDLLMERSLPSIMRQRHPPDSVVIVNDDRSAGARRHIQALVDRRRRDCGPESLWSRVPIAVIDSSRTKGASGAWNSGILHVVDDLLNVQNRQHIADKFVAVLDDDDEWLPNHIELCIDQVRRTGGDVVVAGLVRRDGADKVTEHSIPSSLRPCDFFATNPHVQGSNMFIRLDALLLAGLFDERLPSCTDRDLMVRILDIPSTKVAFVKQHTVVHYAEPHRLRLSTANTFNKTAGLDRFWAKYRRRMSAKHKQQFCRRAKAYFGWVPPSMQGTPARPERETRHGAADTSRSGRIVRSRPERHVYLLGGIICDSRSDSVRPLLRQLSQLTEEQGAIEHVRSIDVLILENGPRPAADTAANVTALAAAVAWAREELRLRCSLISLEQQSADAADGLLPSWTCLDTPLMSYRRSIAHGRTVLQLYLGSMAAEMKVCWGHEPVVWILDSDKQLSKLDNELRVRPMSVAALDELCAHRSPMPTAVFGVDTECPPLPTAFVARSQAVDLYHSLHAFSSVCPSSLASDLFGDGAPGSDRHQRSHGSDFYHDVSRKGSEFMETPFLWSPRRHSLPTGASARDALRAMVGSLKRILLGEPIFRLLVNDVDSAGGDANHAWTESLHRGGSTFVLDANALRFVPNAAPTLNGKQSRRSDMIWACINKHVNGATMMQAASLPVRHVHSSDAVPTRRHAMETVAEDTHGSAIYRALDRSLVSLAGRSASPGLAVLQLLAANHDGAADRFLVCYEQFVRARTATVTASLYRIRGVLLSIRRMLCDHESDRDAAAGGHWWRCDQDISQPLLRFLGDANELFDTERCSDACLTALRRGPYYASLELRHNLRVWFTSVVASRLSSTT